MTADSEEYLYPSSTRGIYFSILAPTSFLETSLVIGGLGSSTFPLNMIGCDANGFVDIKVVMRVLGLLKCVYFDFFLSGTRYIMIQALGITNLLSFLVSSLFVSYIHYVPELRDTAVSDSERVS